MARISRDGVGLVRLALLGATSTAFQTLLCREFLASFLGNEAVLAALLTPWLVAVALGAFLGRGGARKPWHIPAALFALGPVSAATLLCVRILPRLFPAGAAPSVGWALAGAAVLVMPACILVGLSFAWLARDRSDAAGRAYLAESLGAGLAGALLGLVFLGRAPAFAIVGGVVLGTSCAAALGTPRRPAIVMAACGTVIAALLFVLPVGRWALGIQAEHLAGATERQSAHSSIVVTRTGRQTTVFVDRLPVAFGLDVAGAEEAAYIPLSYHATPRAVAVIGVAPIGIVRKALHHGARIIDYVVEDAVLLDTLRAEYAELRHDRVRCHSGDARRFLAERRGTLDVILLFSYEPTSIQRNRLFTREFFRAAYDALRPDGLLALSLPGHAAYASPRTRRLHSSVARTLGSVFDSPIVLPASRTIYLGARDRALPRTPPPRLIGNVLEARGVIPVHLGPSVLGDLLSPERVADAETWSSLHEPVNRDLHPTTYRLALDRTLAQFGEAGSGVLLLFSGMLLIGALVAVRPRGQPVEFAVLTSGMSGLGIELVLMLAFQIATGALYREIALLLAAFMVGAALGAGFGRHRPAPALVLGTDGMQMGLAAGLGVALPWLVAAGPWARVPLFAVVMLAGFLPGAQFAAAARVVRRRRPEAVAGSLWAADLLGAALAAALVIMVLVPALGLRGTLIAIAGAKLASAVALILPREATGARSGRLAPLWPLLFVMFVLLGTADRTHVALSDFVFWQPYQIAAAAAVLLAMLTAFEPARVKAWMAETARRFTEIRQNLAVRAEQIVHFGLLLPVGAFPAARCYFAVPYVFCHVCPRQCFFGVLRRYAVPAALIANLRDHRFCERVCPLGTVQSACEAIPQMRPRRVDMLWAVRIAALLFVALFYFIVQRDLDLGRIEEGSAYAFFFKNTYTPTFAVLAVVAALLVASLFVRRPFCEGLCPIGAASDLVTRLERRLRGRRRPGQTSPSGAHRRHLGVLPSNGEQGP